MADKNVKIAVCSSILGKDGKYGAMIHTSDGRVLIEPDFRFNTIAEAKKAGSALLTKGMEGMQQRGITAYRPESRAELFTTFAQGKSTQPVGTTVVYIPSQAAVEKGSQGLFIVEQYGPLPADFRIYTLKGFLAEPKSVWKETPVSVEWLFDLSLRRKLADLNDPKVFATINPTNAALLDRFKVHP